MSAEAALLSSILAAVALYLATYAPGQAWWRGVDSALPPSFARLVLSLLWTTLVGLALAATGTFSLPRVVAINGLTALAGYLWRRSRSVGSHGGARDLLGPVILAATIVAAWPPYAPFIAGADATGYLASGIHLARHHRPWKQDPAAEKLSPLARRAVFPSARGLPWQPPYTRMVGGMVIDRLGDSIVRPSFFPVPVVWAALFADALGARLAAAFAPLFAGSALWALWLVARRRMPPVPAVAAVVLTGACAAGAWIARMPLADPIAWAFLWAGLAATDAWMEHRRTADGLLAGLALGAACLVRIEQAVFLVLALAVWRLSGGIRRWAGAVPMAALAIMLSATAAEILWLPGAYTAPFAELWSGAVYRWSPVLTKHPISVAALCLAALAAAVAVGRRLGVLTTLCAAMVAATLVAYPAYTHLRLDRSLPWLAGYLGWPALVVCLLGYYRLWQQRDREPGNGLLLCLLAVTAAFVLYNPRVLPVHPWAIRRFVPLILPATILAAALGAARVGSFLSRLSQEVAARSRLRQSASRGRIAPSSVVATAARPAAVAAALLVWAAVAAGILLPARGIWSAEYYRGSYEQLAELAEKIGPDTITLLDTRLAGHVLGAPLWLLYDRNSIPVYAISKQKRAVIAGVTRTLSKDWNVLLLVPAASDLKPIPWTRATRAFEHAIDIEIPGIATKGPPRRSRRLLTHLVAYKLEPIRLPRRPKPPPSAPPKAGGPGGPATQPSSQATSRRTQR